MALHDAKVFERSGIAALADLENSAWKHIVKLLEHEQILFLEKESRFRSDEYSWPRDPLHTWSRIWEYPYTYYHLKSWLNKFAGSALPKVIDVGSGVTFFPFAIARLGYRVMCTDMDPVCRRDIDLARTFVSQSPGEVGFRPTNGIELPFDDADADAVYCISVLEHVPDPGITIREIARILKPGGLFVLTMDLDLKGNSEIGVDGRKELIKHLDESFYLLYPEITVHPLDVLSSSDGPYPLYARRQLYKRTLLRFKRLIRNPLIACNLAKDSALHLAAEGLVLARKGS